MDTASKSSPPSAPPSASADKKSTKHWRHSKRWKLDEELAHYLRLLIDLGGKPVRVAKRVDPKKIVETLILELRAHETGRNAQEHEHVRRRLAELAARMITPVGQSTGSYYLILALSIGRNLTAPRAGEGLGVYLVADTKLPESSQIHRHLTVGSAAKAHADVEIGMTIHCRPGSVEDKDPSDIISKQKFSRDKSPTDRAQAALEDVRELLLHGKDAGQPKVIEKRSDALAVLNILNIILLEEKVAETATHSLDGHVLAKNLGTDVSPGSFPFMDEFMRDIGNIADVSSPLGIAIEHFIETMQQTFSSDQHNSLEQKTTSSTTANGLANTLLLDDDDDDDAGRIAAGLPAHHHHGPVHGPHAAIGHEEIDAAKKLVADERAKEEADEEEIVMAAEQEPAPQLPASNNLLIDIALFPLLNNDQ